MVTIKNTSFTSDMSLSSVYSVQSKAKMMDICKKLDLYVSPNLKKEETAIRLAREVLDNPISVVSTLCKSELVLLKEFYEAGPNAYISKKIRKTPYKLQKYGLVLTNEDPAEGEWHMIMPDCVRISISKYASRFLELVQDNKNMPTAKSIRLLDALGMLDVEES